MIKILELSEIKEKLKDKNVTAVSNLTKIKAHVIYRIKSGYEKNPRLDDVIKLSKYLK